MARTWGAKRDHTWWDEFTAAPVELQRAMNTTFNAREGLRIVEASTDDKTKLAPHKRRLDHALAHEAEIREELAGLRRRADPVTGDVVAAVDLDSS